MFDGTDIRPTADRVKESLFNILYGKISGGTVLDLFCGSGNLGMECISREKVNIRFAVLSFVDFIQSVNFTCKTSVAFKDSYTVRFKQLVLAWLSP